MRNKGLKDFKSKILGLPVFMYAVVMFLYTLWESHGVFLLPLKISLFRTANQKNSN